MYRGALKPYSPLMKHLPPRFADRVLQLEMDIDFHWNLAQLNQLLELYSQGIEWYELNNDRRHIFYQERMQNLLLRSDVIKVMKGEEVTQKIDENLLRTHKENFDVNLRQRASRVGKKFGKKERDTEALVERWIRHTKTSSMQLKSDIHDQNDLIQYKLEERMRLRSGSPQMLTRRPRVLFREDADACAGPEVEMTLEAMMEVFSSRKATLTQEIQAKYLPQIIKLQSSNDSEIVKTVMSSMQKQMQEELDQELRKLENEKESQLEQYRTSKI